ncbi:hypothetical protein B0J13DRAFT_128151 [Dactylonectria estremocensis]|uniref:C3H1-type domain-containing protein n=1 Tax=Dactylonectria estremocensis TaxID=1079267 RepID=A0A9P9JGE7_9HYPO|nr:hypothetical protein B0J13DRAFT_128151 [Dactylonectria estremocensis]
MAPVEVNIYIDNSKLWAQGQKTYAKKNGLEVSQDSTWRFDVGHLLRVLESESGLPGDTRDYDFQFHLFGSTPPPVDSIWLAMEAYDIQMSLSAGSKSTAREKKADYKLLSKAVAHAADAYYRRAPCEIIIASGDPDMLPAVDEIRDDGAPVHIWSWKDELPLEYLDLERSDRHVSVHFLDDYLERISYCDPKLYVEQSSINPNSIVILDAMPKIAEVRKVLSHLKTRLHVYVYDIERTDAIGKDLVVAPAFARKMSYDEFEDFYEDAKHQFELYGLHIVAFWLYRSTYFEDSETGAQLEVSDQFAELPEDTDIPQQDFGPPSDRVVPRAPRASIRQEDTKPVQVKKYADKITSDVNTPKKPAKAFLLRCNFRMYCNRGLDCPRSHTKGELEYFKNNSPKRTRKTRRCRYAKCCTRGAKCPFAHNDAELYCMTCDKSGMGHEMDQCPQKDSLV